MKATAGPQQVIVNTRKGKKNPPFIRVGKKEAGGSVGTVKKIGNILMNIITVAFFIFAAYAIYTTVTYEQEGMLGPEIAGFRTVIIATDSMAPKYTEGALVITKNTKFEKIKVGDIIMYLSKTRDDGTTGVKEVDELVAEKDKNGTAITHRVVTVIEAEHSETGGKLVITKGDNSQSEDPPVDEARYVGRVVFYIDNVQWIVDFVATPTGKVAVGAILIFVLFGIPAFFPDKNKKEKKKAKQRQK